LALGDTTFPPPPNGVIKFFIDLIPDALSRLLVSTSPWLSFVNGSMIELLLSTIDWKSVEMLRFYCLVGDMTDGLEPSLMSLLNLCDSFCCWTSIC
jgi:hypothetical protein